MRANRCAIIIQKLQGHIVREDLIIQRHDTATGKGDLIRRKLTNRTKLVRENDQGIPQSQTADKPIALRGRATQPL